MRREFSSKRSRVRRSARLSSSSKTEQVEARCLLTVIEVTSLADNLNADGKVTLREAIQAANEDTSVDGSAVGDGADVVRFAPGLKGTVLVDPELGELLVVGATTIKGLGAETVIDGNDSLVFRVKTSEEVTIRNLEVREADVAIEARHKRSHVNLIDLRLRANKMALVGRGKRIEIRDSLLAGNKHGAIETDKLKQLVVKGSDFKNNKVPRSVFGRSAAISQRDGDLLISGSSFSGHKVAASSSQGGVIRATRSDVRVVDSLFNDNEINSRNSWGGVLYASPSLSLDRTTISDTKITASNEGIGSAIYAVGDLRITNSTIARNTGAGAIAQHSFNYLGSITIVNSTISGNGGGPDRRSRVPRAAAISSLLSPFRMKSSTVVDNFGARAVFANPFSSQQFEISDSIIANPGEADLVTKSHDTNDLLIRNSLIAKNSQNDLAWGENLEPDENGNIVGREQNPVDPVLFPLADNGTGLETHSPMPGSPVIDGGMNPAGLVRDQRGFARLGGSAPDIGAVELSDLQIKVRGQSVSEGDDGKTTVLIDVVMLSPITEPVEVGFTTVDGTATAGEDYTALDGQPQLEFTEQGQTRQLALDVHGDDEVEFTETFSVMFQSDSGVVGVVGDATIEIEADDFGAAIIGDELVLLGSERNDSAKVRLDDDGVLVRFAGGTGGVFSTDEFSQIHYSAPGGNNRLTVDSTISIPVLVQTGNGVDRIRTGRGDDTILTGGGNDLIVSSGGDDSVRSGAGDDTVELGNGGDSVSSGSGDDVIRTGGGSDQIVPGAGDDTVRAGSGRDLVFGDRGDNRLFGDAGADTIIAGSGSELIHGGEGNDRLLNPIYLGEKFLKEADLPISYRASNSRTDTVRGGAGNDAIRGGLLIEGGDGNDNISDVYQATVYGGAGNDKIDISSGVAYAGSGDDQIVSHVQRDGVEVFGEDGNDVMESTRRGPNSTYLNHQRYVVVFRGGDGDDRLIGGAAFQEFHGDAGNDTLVGGELEDTFYGGRGDDSITGARDNDQLFGDAGDDTLDGGVGDDSLEGGSDADVLRGGPGDDRLVGQAGRDLLVGDTGADQLDGGANEDILVGGFRRGLKLAELGNILDEWSASRDQATRVANVRDGSGSSDNRNGEHYLVVRETIQDDDQADSLLGGAGVDWFFANEDVDVLPDRSGSELFDSL